MRPFRALCSVLAVAAVLAGCTAPGPYRYQDKDPQLTAPAVTLHFLSI